MHKVITPVTTDELKRLREERLERARKISTGIYAKIRGDSKYSDQADEPFQVEIFSDGEYVVHGLPGRYRLQDVDLFWSNGEKLFPCRYPSES